MYVMIFPLEAEFVDINVSLLTVIVECVAEGVWVDTCWKSCYAIVHKSIKAFDNIVGKC